MLRIIFQGNRTIKEEQAVVKKPEYCSKCRLLKVQQDGKLICLKCGAESNDNKT